jgi:hypothetical protein
MKGKGVFVGACILALLWVMYMTMFRTEQWLKICEDDRKRKAQIAGGFAKMVKLGLGAGKWWFGR